MNNNKRTVLAAFIAVCGHTAGTGGGSGAVVMSNMPLALVMELCFACAHSPHMVWFSRAQLAPRPAPWQSEDHGSAELKN